MRRAWLAVILAGAAWGQTAVEPTTLGGAVNASQVAGKLIFAGQPDEAALKEAAARGTKVVINLRMPEEMAQVKVDEAKAAEAAGMSYVSVPMKGHELAAADREKVFALLDAARKPGGRPVFLHCGTSNRVGFVWGLYNATREKLDVEEAVARAKAAGMKSPALEKALREQLAAK